MSTKYKYKRMGFDGYNNENIELIRELIKDKNFLAIPQENYIRVYYKGLKLCDFYGKSCKNRIEINDVITTCGYSFDYINGISNRELVLSAFKDKVTKRDYERASEQKIASSNNTFDDDKYTVFGMEYAIPSNDLNIKLNNSSGKKYKTPKIDLVAFSPKENKFILIEYKCKCESVTGNKGVKEHLKDFKVIKGNEDFQKHLIRELFKAYLLSEKIYTGKNRKQYSEDEMNNAKLDVGFLFCDTAVDVSGKVLCRITSRTYETIYFKEFLDDCDEGIKYIHTLCDDCVDLNNWDNIKDFR